MTANTLKSCEIPISFTLLFSTTGLYLINNKWKTTGMDLKNLDAG